MTIRRPDGARRCTTVALSLVVTLLLISCDRRDLPNGPTPPPPSPQQRSIGPIAFVSDRDGTDRIYLANEDGSLITALVVGGSPAWAKDGRQIAYSGAGNIHVIGVDGSGDRVVAAGGIQPAWSPDGRSLVFMNYRTGDDSEIDVVNLDGSSRRSVFNSGGFGSFEPAWSPDGKRIVFSIGTYWESEFGLWTVNADGSDPRQLAGPGVGVPRGSFGEPGPFWDAAEPAWSPDGSLIAFRSQRYGTSVFSIEVARPDGSGRQLRVPDPAHQPDWTPDGRLIYTKGTLNGPTRIFITDGGTERQLIPEATAPARSTYRDWAAVWLR